MQTYWVSYYNSGNPCTYVVHEHDCEWQWEIIKMVASACGYHQVSKPEYEEISRFIDEQEETRKLEQPHRDYRYGVLLKEHLQYVNDLGIRLIVSPGAFHWIRRKASYDPALPQYTPWETVDAYNFVSEFPSEKDQLDRLIDALDYFESIHAEVLELI